jgi:nucleoside-diphosphate-sugar epimerase
MRRILVTGGAGFIGREVCKVLLKKGYKVRVVDNLSKNSSEPTGVEFLNLDLTVKENAHKAMKGIDICIHLAAKIGGIGYFNKFPATILSENNKLYSSVFEAAVQNKIERIIYISSSMVFENAKVFPSKESDIDKIPPPITSYGFSKLIGEQYCKAFFEEFGLNYTILRPFNAYGINEYPEEEVGYAHVIPDLTKKILSGQYPVEMLGDGKQIRCFTHVTDLAVGIVKAMESKKAINEDFNLANDIPITMEELAKKIWTLSNVKKPFKKKNMKPFAGDVKKRVPDVKKATKLLGWSAKISLDEGLSETIEWIGKALHEK